MRILYIPKKVSPITTIKYGLLYNWYAATDVRSITSSSDWIIPTRSNLTTLNTYLSSDQGAKLKEAGTVYWDNNNGTNEANFNARGCGIRSGANGLYLFMKAEARLWSSTVYTPTASYFRWLTNTAMSFSEQQDGNSNGNYIRLLYVGAGTPTFYTGNDGKTYRVVTIGTQTWIADNLAETKYRDGSLIPEVTDNTAWTALTTGALCAYNNDWSNV